MQVLRLVPARRDSLRMTGHLCRELQRHDTSASGDFDHLAQPGRALILFLECASFREAAWFPSRTWISRELQ
jgi:hypothetical protein